MGFRARTAKEEASWCLRQCGDGACQGALKFVCSLSLLYQSCRSCCSGSDGCLLMALRDQPLSRCKAKTAHSIAHQCMLQCHNAMGDADAGRLMQWWSDLRDSLCRAFLPDRRDVSPDYWEWMQWRLTQVPDTHLRVPWSHVAAGRNSVTSQPCFLLCAKLPACQPACLHQPVSLHRHLVVASKAHASGAYGYVCTLKQHFQLLSSILVAV